MKKINILMIFLALFNLGAKAQKGADAFTYSSDALRYSNLTFGGTARYLGLSGACGALGGDFSTLSTNPAGLGVFRGSEFSFSPSIYTSKTSSTFLEKTSADIKYSFNFGNIGFISACKLKKAYDESPGWKYVNFGFGVNRLADFNNRYFIEGNNFQSSLMTDYWYRANGIHFNDLYLYPFDVELANKAHLLDTIDSKGHYTSAVPINGGVKQSKSITTSGSMNEIVISLAGNYNDKFYIGGTIGFPIIRYYEQSTYKEVDIDTISNFKNLTLNDDVSTIGSGVNFKFGMIYKPLEFIRLGAAVNTPTFFTLKDNYSRTLSSEFDDGNSYFANSPDGEFSYKLETPMRLLGSVGFVIGEFGLISADYEFVDYSAARFRSNSDKFFEANDAIQNNYCSQSNIRVGAEVRLQPITLRGGYAIYGSPYNSGVNDGKKTSLSFGVGIREKEYFIDVAYVYSKSTEDYYLYNPLLVKPASNTLTSNNIMFTLGIKY